LAGAAVVAFLVLVAQKMEVQAVEQMVILQMQPLELAQRIKVTVVVLLLKVIIMVMVTAVVAVVLALSE
jgi:hypothetical protein